MLTLSCQNMEIKATIGNRGFLMYKKYRCSYKHISNSIRNILKWFAALKGKFLWNRVCEKIANRSLFPNMLPFTKQGLSNTSP